MDQEVAVAGAAGTEVGCLGDSCVLGSFLLSLRCVAGIIDDDRRVSCTGTVCRNPCRICGFYHRTSAGSDDEIRTFHELLSQADGRFLDALDNVGRCAFTDKGLTDDIDTLVCNNLCARMRGADDNVSRLDRVDDLSCRSQARVCCRNQRCDHAHRLRVFHDTFFRDLLDGTDALGTQAVP